MDNSRLPIDVCEHIIDECYEVGTRWYSYPVWRHGTLVCSAWLPRSRLNLFHEVFICGESHVDLLVRTLLTAPQYADLVVRVTVNSDGYGSYVPFARMPLSRLLKKCVALDLSTIKWSKYPPRYADTGLRSWSSLMELKIKIKHKVLRGVLRFVWSLPELQTLDLRCNDTMITKVDTLGSSAVRFNLKTGSCNKLRTLILRVCDLEYDAYALRASY